MTRTLFSTTATLLLLAAPTSAPANDIVDFFRAISGGPSSYRHAESIRTVGRRHDHGRYQTTRHVARQRTSFRAPRPILTSRPGLSFHVSLGNSAPPPVPVIPQAPAPGLLPPAVYNHAAPLHQVGDFVTCPVNLEPHVVVRDTCRIAPGACPAVIAVRDPHQDRRACVQQLVYVEIFVPPCPLQRIRISPCKTKIRLDYGKYEVDIVSRNDCVHIDYDN